MTLPPDSHVMLHRSTNRYDMATNTSFKVFEAATCSFCAAVYLVGKIENGKLEQYNMSDDISTKELFLLADSINDTDNDHILRIHSQGWCKDTLRAYHNILCKGIPRKIHDRKTYIDKVPALRKCKYCRSP